MIASFFPRAYSSSACCTDLGAARSQNKHEKTRLMRAVRTI
ncbi:hypothetical protein [Chroococcidiopsis sp. SAG 2025]|nr:hypothetical protein [Chroococcidiopsis sp. SAG 2025]